MIFREQLQSAAGQLTAAQIAEATGASIGTVYAWRQGRRKPKAREQAVLLTRIKRARARAERRTASAMQCNFNDTKTKNTMNKKLGFYELKGKRINAADKWDCGDKSWLLHTDAGRYELQIDDDGCGCNDSNAFLSDVRGLDEITGKEIVAVDEESDSYGAEIKLRTSDGSECAINITHEQNGYYGYSYELVCLA